MSTKLSPRSKKQAAFSQSLTNVRWRFLREDKHIQDSNIEMSVPIVGIPSSTKSGRRNKNKYNKSIGGGGSSVFSAGSEVLRQAPPSVPNISDERSTLVRVRQLQEELSNNDFPSKIFRFLSIDNNSQKFQQQQYQQQQQQQQWGDNSTMNSFNDSSLGDGRSVLSNGISSYDTRGFSPEAIQREMERLSQANVDPSTTNATKYQNKAMFKAATAEKHTAGVEKQGNYPESTTTATANGDEKDRASVQSESSVSSSDSDSDDDRPVSPIIIWRPSARVQIADDLPADLLAELLGQPLPSNSVSSSSQNSGNSTTRSSSVHGQGSSSVGTGSHSFYQNSFQTSANAILQGNTSKISTTKPFLNKNYGAWYLKPKKWYDMMTGDLQSEYEKSQNARISGSDVEIEKVINVKAKELETVLPKLFISTVYREWLEKQEQEHPESALPMPHYLKKRAKGT
jgi:hypothetical protein